MSQRRRRPTQLGLDLAPRTWGGARKGAGRKPKGVVPHARRPEHVFRHPVHVTLRLARHVWNLRSQRGFAKIEEALRRTRARGLVRIVHYSVQHDHIHMIVEADDRSTLARGIKGFEVRLAWGLNELMRLKGRTFGDRYYARALRSPREVRRVLVYVINNRVHHKPELEGLGYVDPYSSGSWFDGWTRRPAMAESACRSTGPPTHDGTVWLLTTGWRRHRLLVPGSMR